VDTNFGQVRYSISLNIPGCSECYFMVQPAGSADLAVRLVQRKATPYALLGKHIASFNTACIHVHPFSYVPCRLSA
jgi:hypothetical protein